MEKFDLVVLGGGPTAVSVFEHYVRRKGCSGRLIVTASADPGAAFKGVKTVNPIITKLPYLRYRNLDMYREITERVIRSVVGLELIYEGSSNAYHRFPKIGIRLCRNQEELEALRDVDMRLEKIDTGFIEAVSRFTQKQVGHEIDNQLLYTYGEKIWDVEGYMERFLAKIDRDHILDVESVSISSIGNQGMVILKIVNPDGSVEEIAASKVLVCRGMGNVQFEKTISDSQGLSEMQNLSFNVLKYHKTIHQSELAIPHILSSILLPHDGICLTNEFEYTHSFLHNTNEGPVTSRMWAAEQTLDHLTGKRESLSNRFPGASHPRMRDFMCPMPIDTKALVNPQKYFEFIMSNSSIPNIHYVNLTYFTTIAAAVDNLPKNLNGFKNGK